MSRVRLYNVWHNKLFDELYESVPSNDIRNVIMYGVNENYQKHYNVDKGYNVCFEYDLPLYEPVWQQRGFCQTTCMMHVYKNGLYKDLDYIGFIQYDMAIHADCFGHIRATLEHHKDKPVLFYSMTESMGRSAAWARGLVYPYAGSALEHYNMFFGTHLSEKDVCTHPAMSKVPLLHTFVIPIVTFEKMMSWMESYMTTLEAMYPKYPSNVSQAEFSERCLGLFLAIENAICPMHYEPLHVEHIWPLYHNKTDWYMYKVPV